MPALAPRSGLSPVASATTVCLLPKEHDPTEIVIAGGLLPVLHREPAGRPQPRSKLAITRRRRDRARPRSRHFVDWRAGGGERRAGAAGKGCRVSGVGCRIAGRGEAIPHPSHVTRITPELPTGSSVEPSPGV